MSNAAAAFPQVEVVCKDRKRNFCLNLGALRALEELLQTETGDPKFDVRADFDWSDLNTTNLIKVLWAGFFTDAKNDPEPWTLDKAAEVISVLGVQEIELMILTAFRRSLSSEQLEKAKELEADTEKKTNDLSQ